MHSSIGVARVRVAAAVAFGVAVAVLLACGDGDGTGPGTVEPAAILGVSGDAQEDTVGATLDDPLVVEVTTADGDPAPGTQVEWSTSSGSLSTATTTTDTEGHASVEWTLGSAAGTDTATASVQGLEPVRFTATAVPGRPDDVTLSPDSIALTAVDDTIRLGAAVTDANGNAVSDRDLAWTSSDTSVASVTAAGLVQAGAEGAAEVWVDAADASDTVHVHVHLSRGVDRTWAAAGSAAWTDPLNWLPAGRPNARDTTRIEADAEPVPVVGAGTEALRVVVADGAMLEIQGGELVVHGDVHAAGAITGAGPLVLAGPDAALLGAVPRTVVTGAVTLTGTTTVTGPLSVDGGSVDLAGLPLRITP